MQLSRQLVPLPAPPVPWSGDPPSQFPLADRKSPGWVWSPPRSPESHRDGAQSSPGDKSLHVSQGIDDSGNGSIAHHLVTLIQFDSPTCLWPRVSPPRPRCHTCPGTCPDRCRQCPGSRGCQCTCSRTPTPGSRSSSPVTRGPAPPWSPPRCHHPRQWCREEEEISK